MFFSLYLRMEKKKKAGRPEAGQHKLSEVLRIRLTKDESDKLKSDAIAANIKPSEIGRRYVTKGYVVNLFSDEEQLEKRKLIGVSNNLNQLVKLAHLGGYKSQAKHLDMLLDEIDEILKKYNDVSRITKRR